MTGTLMNAELLLDQLEQAGVSMTACMTLQNNFIQDEKEVQRYRFEASA
jgi:uridylate kinase